MGSYAKPVLFDLLGDGVVRLLVGDSGGLLDMLTEVGGAWEVTQVGFNGLDVGSYASPTLGDTDGDVDLDLLIGNSSGQMLWRQNRGDASQPSWLDAPLLRDSGGTVIDVGSYAAPSLADLDADGDLDIVVGDSGGRLDYIRNDGDALTASWVPTGELSYAGGGLIDVGSYATPFAVDVDGDGDLDLLVGDSGGQVRLLRNVGDASNPSFTNEGDLAREGGGTIDVGSYSRPALYDSDGNGTLDMLLVGSSSGTLTHFGNRASGGLSLVDTAGRYDGIDVGSYAAPALADIDNDGDADLCGPPATGRRPAPGRRCDRG